MWSSLLLRCHVDQGSTTHCVFIVKGNVRNMFELFHVFLITLCCLKISVVYLSWGNFPDYSGVFSLFSQNFYFSFFIIQQVGGTSHLLSYKFPSNFILYTTLILCEQPWQLLFVYLYPLRKLCPGHISILDGFHCQKFIRWNILLWNLGFSAVNQN